ncbi:MAG: flagellar hook-associated protein FlgK [Candidatus Sericytochromatia bacterium]|nr:flagellar hook-associated protein FlgK [Candidatus Sericytochromatia bacterium]
MNVGLYASVSGLLTAQRAIDVASHNIANAETEGFSRQRGDVSTAVSLSIASVGNLGTGVKLDGIRRVRDELLDRQFRQEQATLGEMEVRAESLGKLEDLLGEPGEGSLSQQFNVYFESWQRLTTNPENTSFRLALRESALKLTQTFNQLSEDVENMRSDLNDRANSMVTDINTKASQVAELNRQIVATLVQGQSPNDLQDQRDLLIDQLTKLVKVQVVPIASSGAINVYLGNQRLVAGASHYPLDQTTIDPTKDTATIFFAGTKLAAPVEGGSLKALLELRNETLARITPDTGKPAGLLNRLDELANKLITDTNVLHQGGFGLEGSTGKDFFTGTRGAADITLNTDLLDSFDGVKFNYGYLAIGAAAQPPGDAGSGSSNNDMAQQISARRFAKVLTVVDPPPGAPPEAVPKATQSFEEYWQATVMTISVTTQSVTRTMKTQESLIGSVKERREAISAVSTDEEMANVIRYQKAYAASARMLTTIDEMLDTLLSIGR